MKIETADYTDDPAPEVMQLLREDGPYRDALGCLAAAVQERGEDVEMGVTVSEAVFKAVVGDRHDVSLPVSGTESRPALYLHSQPTQSKPSSGDIRATWERPDRTHGAVILAPSDHGEGVTGKAFGVPPAEVRDRFDEDDNGTQLFFEGLLETFRVEEIGETYREMAADHGLL